MYTFSTKYIFSGHQSDIVTDVSEGAALKKMKQFQSRRKGNGSIWNFFCCFHLSHRVFHWKLTENVKFLLKKEILFWFSLIVGGIWICYKQKCEVSDIARPSQPVWIVHLFFLENVRCPSHCLELKGERSLNPWPGRLNPSITQNRKSRGIWNRSLRLSLTKKGGTAHLNQASLRNLCKIVEIESVKIAWLGDPCKVSKKRPDFWLLVVNQVNWQHTKLRLNFTSIDR